MLRCIEDIRSFSKKKINLRLKKNDKEINSSKNISFHKDCAQDTGENEVSASFGRLILCKSDFQQTSRSWTLITFIIPRAIARSYDWQSRRVSINC